MWRRDGGELGTYAGCPSLYVLGLRGQELISIMKVLVSPHEIYVDEVCTALDMQRKQNYHTLQAFEALLLYLKSKLPHIVRFRLQVAKANVAAQKEGLQEFKLQGCPRKRLAGRA